MNPMSLDFYTETSKILAAVTPANPNVRTDVGQIIFRFVVNLIGQEKAPKITGMLIDLPIEEIKGYLYDFAKLYQKIGDAVNLLNQLQAQGQ